MYSKIHLSDLLIIQKIIGTNKDKLVVFDPNQRLITDCKLDFVLYQRTEQIEKIVSTGMVLVNLSDLYFDHLLSNDHFEHLIHFGQKKQPTKGQHFHYINNPDQRMRWFFPSSNRFACHLELYNSAGLKATLYKQLTQFLYRMDQSHWLASGSFSIESKESAGLIHQLTDIPFDEYAVFTGTTGPNRKALLAIMNRNNCSHFIKIPIGPNATALLENEHHQLEQLSHQVFQRLQIPVAKPIDEHLMISNVKPDKAQPAGPLSKTHLKALFELYNRTATTLPLRQLPVWQDIQDKVDFLTTVDIERKDIPQKRIQKTIALLQKLYTQIKQTDLIPVALAHGDFTPWNMYASDKKLHLYDWELSQSKMPMLYDAFHYIFQQSILIDRISFSRIRQAINNLKKDPIVSAIRAEHRIQFDQHYAFYLLYTISYYLCLYIEQDRWHPQVNWLINTWLAALQDIQRPDAPFQVHSDYQNEKVSKKENINAI